MSWLKRTPPPDEIQFSRSGTTNPAGKLTAEVRTVVDDDLYDQICALSAQSGASRQETLRKLLTIALRGEMWEASGGKTPSNISMDAALSAVAVLRYQMPPDELVSRVIIPRFLYGLHGDIVGEPAQARSGMNSAAKGRP